MPRSLIYNGRDPRELPAYSFADAARYIDVPSATIRSWVAGRTYPKSGGVGSFEPVIRPADSRTGRLSFYNLVEAHVLRSLRTRHAVPLKHVRPAIAYAEQKMGIPRLLLSKQLQTHAGELFLEHLGSLVNLSKSGQLAIRQMLEAHLQRVEWDDRAIPVRLYPFTGLAADAEGRPVVIDPNVSFGRPTVRGTGILTSAVVARIDAGESPRALADDFGLTEAQINAAILYERAA